jgi:hypothetical protein
MEIAWQYGSAWIDNEFALIPDTPGITEEYLPFCRKHDFQIIAHFLTHSSPKYPFWDI